jgi:hypothetical protein
VISGRLSANLFLAQTIDAGDSAHGLFITDSGL